jgi:hypothetical protein
LEWEGKEDMDLQKNLDRLNILLFQTCGCTREEARIVAETFLKELYLPKKESDVIKSKRIQEYEDWISKILDSDR